ncbi:phospholipase D-like domain-containing protein [Pedobacter montanisoli]|uniref:phospholipase D n=1 Tax=Pedobacter montanisoli TaxID=2923277 RepID=A0ABS9ZXX7_9SPHI|nr:phospholipase D-like domain-containing protein [Pedobacter montanisoli]MCJ0743181.1 phospholipase D-like domain-containing protein [Pedobacter montanisoli]
MNSFKIYFLALFLAFAGCKKTSENSNNNNNNGGTDQGTSVNLTLPSSVFTELDKVSKGQSSTAIMDKLISMINATPASAHIYMSIYMFDYQPLINALKEASNRGVYLHIMIDSSIDDSIKQNMSTIGVVRDFVKSGSELVIVTNDVNTSSINHNKFVLFSELKTTNGNLENVVFQTSHNFTLDDSKKIQDAIILNDIGLYNAYIDFWKDIKAKSTSGMKDYYYKEYSATDGKINAYFFPKRRNGTSYGEDSIIEILNNISDLPNATIRVGMSDWVASRINVANKLSELLDKGAKVEIVVKNKIDSEIQTVLKSMEQRGATVKMYNISQTNIHSKFLMIDGKYKGEQCKIIATGSHNYTTNALRNNNETLVLLKNYTEIYNNYLNYYTEMKKLPGITIN